MDSSCIQSQIGLFARLRDEIRREIAFIYSSKNTQRNDFKTLCRKQLSQENQRKNNFLIHFYDFLGKNQPQALDCRANLLRKGL